MIKSFIKNTIIGIIVLCTCCNALAFSVIRDAQTEYVLKQYLQRAFEAAGLNPENADLVLINDPSVNAFVAGGQTVFIHTGLITTAENVDDFMFVISHEIGHIVGGHIVRGYQEYQKLQNASLITTVLGGLVALASGRPDAGIAVMMGGNTSALGMFTAYRQTEESTADRTAVDIMEKTGYSLQGFNNIMKTLRNQERIIDSGENPYFRTHPMTQQRINDMNRFLTDTKPVHKDAEFDLVRAKLIAFLSPIEKTKSLYRDDSLPARYARAIALYRDNKVSDSLKAIDELIAEYPENPYFHELKGQIFFETAQIQPSIQSYKKALSFLPDSLLINLAYANALLESAEPNEVSEAIQALQRVVHQDTDIPAAWQLLARAYDLQNKSALSNYAMAEFYMATHKSADAQRMAEQALKGLKKDEPTYQRAKDIIDFNKKSVSDKKN